jgi:hypothetical protein
MPSSPFSRSEDESEALSHTGLHQWGPSVLPTVSARNIQVLVVKDLGISLIPPPSSASFLFNLLFPLPLLSFVH